jgi:hypothetical protein
MKNTTFLKTSNRINSAIIIVFILSAVITGFANAQSSPSIMNTKDEKEEKNLFVAASEVFAANILVWSYHEFLTKEGWANINLTTMKNNLKLGFTWDYDDFTINQFLHPYH